MKPLRAAVHVHSSWSYDAEVPLAELAEAFCGRGYDVVFMAEHDRGFSHQRWQDYREECADASREGLLLVPGVEYADPEDRIHVPVWGCSEFLGAGVPTTELLQRVTEFGGFAVLAHPARRDAWEVIDPAWYPDIGGIEVWTRKWDGWAPNQRSVAVAARYDLLPVVSLDLHRLNQFFPLAMSITLEGAPTPRSALAGLRATAARPLLRNTSVSTLARRPTGDVLTQVERLRRPAVRLLRPVLRRIRP